MARQNIKNVLVKIGIHADLIGLYLRQLNNIESFKVSNTTH